MVRRLPPPDRDPYSHVHHDVYLFTFLEPLMQNQSLYANPFALMMDPQAVLEAMGRSERLNRLQSRVCRPLDKPLIPLVNSEEQAYDQEIDAAPDVAEEAITSDDVTV